MDENSDAKTDKSRFKPNILSKIFFIWIIKIYCKALKQRMQIKDLFKISSKDSCKVLGDKLEDLWKLELNLSETKKRNPSLLRILIKTSALQFSLNFIFQFLVVVIIRPYQCVLLAIFIALFGEEYKNVNVQCIAGGAIVISGLLSVFFHHLSWFSLSLQGMRVRIALSSLIYKKMLKLSNKSINAFTLRKIKQLLTQDVYKLDHVCVFLPHLLLVPIQILLIAGLLWQQIGISCLPGVILILFIILPFESYKGIILSNLRLKTSKKTNIRMRLMNEIIAGINFIKMSVWEKPFEQLVKIARSIELIHVSKSIILTSTNFNIVYFVPKFIMYLTVMSYFFLANVLSPSKIFSAITFFNIIRQSSMSLFSQVIVSSTECYVSIKQIEEFLLLDEINKPSDDSCKKREVVFDNVSSKAPYLDLCIPHILISPGNLCCIVGPSYSGKTSLVKILLGEQILHAGFLKANGKLSFYDQETWFYDHTIRENIIVDEEFAELRYNRIIRSCQLSGDFQQFPQGDQSVVGKDKLKLTDDQRARIALARSVYKNADIYILDDPFADISVNYSKNIFEECVLLCLAGKTKILITHQLHHLKMADRIVVMSGGRVDVQGTFLELTQRKFSFAKMFVSPYAVPKRGKLKNATKGSEILNNSPSADLTTDLNPEAPTALWQYLKSGGSTLQLSLLFILIIACQALYNASDFWLAIWTNRQQTVVQEKQVNKTITFSHKDNFRAVEIYSSIIIVALICTLIKLLASNRFVYNASKYLHMNMLKAVLMAPVQFFTQLDKGGVLRGFSKDIGVVDEPLPEALIETTQCALTILGAFILIITCNVYMVLVCLVGITIVIKLQLCYVKITRQFKHLYELTKVPIEILVNSTLKDIISIRANEYEEKVLTNFIEYQDVHTSAHYLVTSCVASFGMWLDFISTIFIAIVTFSFILLNNYWYEIEASYVGLAISQGLTLTGLLQYGVIRSTVVINSLASVRRILEYSKIGSEEEVPKNIDQAPIAPWLKTGKIEFRNVYLKDNKHKAPLLKNINFVIEPKKKIGILRRYGGETSHILSIITRLANFEGTVLINEVDIKTVEPTIIRKYISVIPKECLVFSDTVRFNLDPLQEFTDIEIWQALQQVELREVIVSLNFVLSTEEPNITLVQRRLLCLARALLHTHQILIIDETTDNIDPRTNELIQEIIRRHFIDITVVTISHRLKNLIESDMVMVFDRGELIEFNHPHILLLNDKNLFSKLVAESGVTMAQQLKQIASRNYLNRN